MIKNGYGRYLLERSEPRNHPATIGGFEARPAGGLAPQPPEGLADVIKNGYGRYLLDLLS